MIANRAGDASGVGEGAVWTGLTAVPSIVQPLTTSTLVTAHRSFVEVEGPRVALLARSRLNRSGVSPNCALGARRSAGRARVGAGRAVDANFETWGRRRLAMRAVDALRQESEK